MKRIAIAIAAAGLIVSLSACEVPAEAGANTQQSSGGASATNRDAKADKPEMTRAQENAVGSAENYLDTLAFSRSGLISQLKFEDYSTKDATFAVDHLDPNWKAQAAKSAENYLDTMSFSRGGLIDQLEFDGYTTAQATHGVDEAGL